MTLAFEHLGGLESGLGQRDPRWKLAALLAAAAAVAALQTLPAAAAALAGALLLALVGGMPSRWLFARLGAVALMLVPFAILPLLPGGGPAWRLGPLRLSIAGLELALLLIGKALALATLVLALAASSPLVDTLKAAQSLRIPRVLVHLALMAYRYVFLLADTLDRLRTALRVRGFRAGANLHSYRTIGHVAGILLVHSGERAERVSQAMACRGFDGRFRTLTSFRTGAADVALCAGLVGAGAFLVVWDTIMR